MFYNLDGDYVKGMVNIDDPYGPVGLVTERFTQTINKASEVLELLIGTDGNGGLLGDMTDAIGSAPHPSISADEIDTSMLIESSGLSLPAFDKSGMVAIPTLDIDFSGIDMPEDITLAMSWAEANLPAEVYTALRAQILADLVDGSTGITEAVETAIYTRARNRQQVANLAEFNRINNTIANLQHSLPAGVSISLLADFGIGQARQEADLEYGITEQQAKLAQDNRKSAIQGAIALDQMLRQTRDSESNRNYQSAKDLATLTLQEYSEKIKGFLAKWEGKRAEVQAKAEAIRAAVDTNKGIVEVFKAEAEAFSSAENAVGIKNETGIKLIQARVSAAELSLRAQIAEAANLIQAYTAESSISERISSDRVNAVSQVAASLLSAVHAGASIGYSGSESSSKGYHVSVSASESHSAEHDPES